jgi:hypothetical protein
LVLNAVWGVCGAQDFQELANYQSRLRQSISSLEQTRQYMETELERLRHDPSRLRQEAHRIGMIGANETRIKIPADLSVDPASPVADIASKPDERALPKALITGVSLSLGIVLLLVLTLLDLETNLAGNPSPRRRPYSHHGMRVQTASRE